MAPSRVHQWFPTVASLAGVSLDAPTKAWVKGRDGTVELLGKGTAGPREIPLTWDYRFGMPGLYCADC